MTERVSETQAFGMFAAGIGEAGDYDQFKNFTEQKVANRTQFMFKRTFS